MLTTQNIYRPGDETKPTSVSTVKERMAKLRAIKDAKRAARRDEALAKAGAAVREPGVEAVPMPTTTGAAPTALYSGTPGSLSPQTTQQLQTILRDLQKMYDPSSIAGGQVAKALKLLEAPVGGITPGVSTP